MATVLKARKEAAEAKVDSHPSIIELRKMHCDPAIAREFELLKAENKKLQQEASRLRELDMGNKFEVRAPVRYSIPSHQRVIVPACCMWLCKCCAVVSHPAFSPKRTASTILECTH